jgi:hypothetical protein
MMRIFAVCVLLVGLLGLLSPAKAAGGCGPEVQATGTVCSGQVSGGGMAGTSFKVIAQPIIGLARSVSLSQSTGASTSAAFFATQIVVGPGLSGLNTMINNLSQTINFGTTGAGGCDAANCAVASGFADIYAAWNPTSITASAFACADTTCAGSQFYNGASAPSGYTQTALIAIVPTSLNSIKAGGVHDRHWWYTTYPSVFTNTTGLSALTKASLSSPLTVPTSTTYADFLFGNTGTAATIPVLASEGGGVGAQGFDVLAGSNTTCSVSGTGIPTGLKVCLWFANIPIFTSQAVWWAEAANIATDALYVTGYQW